MPGGFSPSLTPNAINVGEPNAGVTSSVAADGVFDTERPVSAVEGQAPRLGLKEYTTRGRCSPRPARRPRQRQLCKDAQAL
jgi:hypothetical protein